MPFACSSRARAALSILAVALGLAFAGCAAGPDRAPTANAPATQPGPRVMATAANPLAVDAAIRVLREGGSAVDAAVAVQAVLGLVEPQSSGLGGGAFMTFYDAQTRRVTAYNGRETAPAGATPDMFLGPNGRPMPFGQAVTSGRSTGAPGAVAMLAMAHADHGKLPWSRLFIEAERLADDGFVVSPRLAGMIAGAATQARPDARAYFTKPDGAQYKAGDVLKNPAYADTIRRIAAEGPKGLLAGPVGEAIVAKVREGLAGTLTLEDMAAYKPIKSDGLCTPWRVYIVCVPPPPSGGASLLEGLKLLERTDIAARGPNDPVAWVKLAEAERLMYADRDRYMADPDFVPVPVAGLLSDGYIAERAALIGDRAAATPPAAGTPPGAAPRGADNSPEPGGTTHMVIVDADGDAVSMTTTVESVFGSGRMARGFFLNNQLTDFSLSPTGPDGAPVANAVAPGKRPRSAMSPVIVLDKDRRFVAALGSPGGPAILSYNLKALIGVFDWGLPMQQAVDLPNLVARGSNFSGEVARFGPELSAALQARGVTVREGQNENSGLHGVIRRPTGLEGGADSRREGVVRSF